MLKINKILLAMFFLGLMISGCNSQAVSTQTVDQKQPDGTAQISELTILTHDSFSISEELITQFESKNHVKINFIKGGDAGSVLNKAILTKNTPQADVLFGLDNTFLPRALKADIFGPYNSPVLSEINNEFILDPEHRVTPVDYGDVCINYDKAYFKEKGIKLPESLEDLTRPEYKGLLVVENPATSSPGMAFLLATISEYGPDQYLDYWGRLKANGVVIVDGWETAYYTNFSGSSGKGPQPMVVSYGSSPAAEVIFAEEPPKEAPTASIIGKNTCFRQVEFAGILKGSKNRALAEKWIDFMISKSFQEDIPLQMFVFPVNKNAVLPEAFILYNQIPEQPAQLPLADIDSNREKWIEAWRGMILK